MADLDKTTLVPILEMMGYKTLNKTDIWKKPSDDPKEFVFWAVDFKNGDVFKWVEDHREYDAPDDPIFVELKNLVGSISVGEPIPESTPSNADQSKEKEYGKEESTSEEKASPAYQNNDTQPAAKPEEKPPQPSPAADKKSTPLLDLIHQYTGNDVLEVFGDTGSGKSKFAMTVAREAIASGKKVFYLDTERNLTEADVKDLKGCEYKYTPIIDEIDKIVQNLPKVDVVVIDSIGFPVLTTFARMSVKQKGDALLKLIAIFGDLKSWAYRNNGIVVVTNQPESEFNKDKDHILRPFGDKSQFAAKEIWKTEIVDRKPAYTNIRISAFRSRSVGHRTKIADMKITGNGVEVSA
ncbi:MAG: AAA family ATPase [Methanolobus sp.]|uniref:AAA family ATPase n=1 Tax=Methanolobus sp. TaxID=1874737 RepID=UPI00272FC663|nr:AAA family ATPase [Methanolobus sp.]MDP2217480.1 AAA family ATPase [Methanolobus sp.]